MASSLHIDTQADHVISIARPTQPVEAVAELVWNSLDAEAMNVNVELERDDMDAVTAVIIRDDGHGIEPELIASSFERLGGSWKKSARSSPNLKRALNGRHGRGRLRAFALGHRVAWTTTAQNALGEWRCTRVSGKSSAPTDFERDDVPVVGDGVSGTEFRAVDPADFANRLTSDGALPRLTSIFAVFLTENPNVTILFDGKKINPKTAEKKRYETYLEGFATDGEQDPFLRVIEWKRDPGRAIHFCDESGSIMGSVPPDIHTPGLNYTAYVIWGPLESHAGEFELADMDDGLLPDLLARTRDSLKNYYRTRDVERRKETVAEWKQSGAYPYKDEPADEAQRIERETFDYVATSASRKLPKSTIGRKTTLALLKYALSREPSTVPRIVEEVLPLTKREQEDLSRLLDRTSMSKLIAANSQITSRLDFLAALRAMVFDPQGRKVTRERKELHRLLANEIWVFGDEYNLMVSDKGLDEVLARHISLIRPEQRAKSTEGKVRRGDGSKGIVDLMLSQQRRGMSRREHLVVELKRPNVTISQKEVGQLKSYADAVIGDAQFHAVDVFWDFWIVSTDLDATVKRDANQVGKPAGLIGEYDNARLWARTWSEVLSDNEQRLRYFKEALEYDASREHAADYLDHEHSEDAIPTNLRLA